MSQMVVTLPINGGKARFTIPMMGGYGCEPLNIIGASIVARFMAQPKVRRAKTDMAKEAWTRLIAWASRTIAENELLCQRSGIAIPKNIGHADLLEPRRMSITIIRTAA